MVDWLNELREGIIEAYSGIIQGLKGDDPNNPSQDIVLLEPHLQFIIQFITIISADTSKNDTIIGVSAGLIG